MRTISRALALATTFLLAGSSLLILLAPAATATPGRDSPAAAVDGATGPFLGFPASCPGTIYTSVGPPVEEDWYKFNVTAGQIFQASLWATPGGRISVYHGSDTTNAISFADALSPVPGNVAVNGWTTRVAFLDLFIWKTEQIYVKVSPRAMGGTQQCYNLYMRAYEPTLLTQGTPLVSADTADSIQGWSYPWYFGSSYESDFFWANVSDGAGFNHQRYRVQLTQTCATAMYDLYLYQFLDPATQRLDLLNHSLALQRRLDRGAITDQPEAVEWAPALYDGKYLVQVLAVENGSFSANSADRYHYTLSLTTSGGLGKDGDDRSSTGTWVNTTQKVNGHLDGRDDSGDWMRMPLLQGDQVSATVTFSRPGQEIENWGLRFNAIVFAPNGTVVLDEVNYHFSGPTLNYDPYISLQQFTAGADGNYTLLLYAADGALDFNAGVLNSGGTGVTWADYEVSFLMPNRKPVQLAPLPDLNVNEDTSGVINFAPYFMDPERKFGYPSYQLNGTYSNFTFALIGSNLTVNPKADWNGRVTIKLIVRDDFNYIDSSFNVTVQPVNDGPRLQAGAQTSYSMLTLAEDAETTLPLRGIFTDIDDPDLNFTAGGVAGSHLAVFINPTSQIATITPESNWCGQADIVWTATDPALLPLSFTTTVMVDCVNDAPVPTLRRLDRIVFNEGGEYTIDLSGEFFDLDGDQLQYYGIIEDPVVSTYVRINNTLLVPTDPLLRIYVLDRYRADYFTDGPVQIRFGVRDPHNNYDPLTGQNLTVEKTTFLEILNVNDPPLVDDFSPTPSEVATTEWHEGDTITFSVTNVKDPDNEVQFFFKWFVNGDEIPQETAATYVFKTVQDATRPGQFAEGNYTITVQVFDAAGAKALREQTWTFEVMKTNRVPTLQILRPTSPTFEEGSFIDFQALATDEDPEDAGRLTITWTYVGPSGRPVVMGTGDRLRTMLDPGNYTITVRATDGIAQFSRSISISVNAHAFNTPGFDLSAVFLGLAGAAGAAGVLGQNRRRRP